MGRSLRRELEPILEREPSAKTFRAICKALGAGTASKEVLSLVEGALEAWPSTVPRRAPDTWLDAVSEGKRVPALRLCRTIHAQGCDDYLPTFLGFIGSTYLSEIRCITLFMTSLGDEACAAIASSKHLRKLSTLDLAHTDLGDEGLRALLRSKSLGAVTNLGIGGNPLSDEALVEFFASPLFAGLDTLWATAHAERDMTTLPNLLEAPRTRPLRTLCVSGWRLGTERLRQLLDSSLAKGLEELRVSATGIGPEDAVLFDRDALPALRRLVIRDNGFGVAERDILEGNLPGLESLDMKPVG